MAQRTTPVRVGILGLGRIYDLHVLGHRDNLGRRSSPSATRTPTGSAERGPEWPDAARYSDLDEFLAQTSTSSTCWCRPRPIARSCVAALEAGHDVNVQKPMAMTLDEADRMVETAERTGGRCG